MSAENNTGEVIETLISTKNRIMRQIETLKGDLEAINRLLNSSVFNGVKVTPELKELSQIVNFSETASPVKPTVAIKSLFNRFPEKQWTPTELRDELKRLKNEGKLITSNPNLLNLTHTVLRTLAGKYVTKLDGNDGIPTYIKKGNSNMKLPLNQ